MTIDELELEHKPEEKATEAQICDPCANPKNRSCINCEWSGDVEPSHTWKPNATSPMEPMRLCYNFAEFVPARATFYCSLWEKKK